MDKNDVLSPVLKWAGGKRGLLHEIVPLLPPDYNRYCEPFLGGGAVLLAIQPENAIVNDTNEELINVYEVIRDDVDGLIKSLETYENSAEFFYRVRKQDRDPGSYATLSKTERASRIIYLNKTCYNGLYRVNSKGEFNVPFGRYKSPNIVNAEMLRALHSYLSENDITFYHEDFCMTMNRMTEGDFVYLDPPYYPISGTSGFTGYSKGGFGRAEQIRLKKACDSLDRRGVRFMLSNSSAAFIKDLYSGYNVTTVRAGRAINSKADGRGKIDELIIRNYQT